MQGALLEREKSLKRKMERPMDGEEGRQESERDEEKERDIYIYIYICAQESVF